MLICECGRYVGFSGGISRKSVVNPYHVSYAPVSAQDSELQSLSSDAPTDDTATSHTTDSSSAYVSLSFRLYVMALYRSVACFHYQ